ncbi:hypothetical protein E4T52_01960 [Aureobasidium sp. EXF-3400]|nr:hypothetical protein E4T52_01960 [Aureobasidium sp. EXF-3400]
MASTEGQCAGCSKPGKLCKGCLNIRYCGAECQGADWSVHKPLCRSFKDVRDAPGPDMVRVIEFPVNDINPKFRWMPIDLCGPRPLRGDFFGSDGDIPETASFIEEPKTGKMLSLRITCETRSCFQTDDSLPNKSVHHLTNEKPRLKWAGPILFYGNVLENPEDDEDKVYECIDLDTIHLNVIKDWLSIGNYVDPVGKALMNEMKAKGHVFSASDMVEMFKKMGKWVSKPDEKA